MSIDVPLADLDLERPTSSRSTCDRLCDQGGGGWLAAAADGPSRSTRQPGHRPDGGGREISLPQPAQPCPGGRGAGMTGLRSRVCKILQSLWLWGTDSV